MKTSPKPLVAGALFAGTLLLGGGIAAAVALPDDASGTATDHVTPVETGKPDDAEATTDDTEDEATDDTEDETTAEPEDEATAETEDEAVDAEDDASADDESEDEEDGGERPTDTHGYEVSNLAKSTELEGRAKGAAVSDLARTNGGKSGEDDDGTEQEAGKPAKTGRSADAPGKK